MSALRLRVQGAVPAAAHRKQAPGQSRTRPEVQELRFRGVGHEGPEDPRAAAAQEQGHQVPPLRLLHLPQGMSHGAILKMSNWNTWK